MVAPFELGAADAAAAIRTGDLTAQALAEALLARCTAAASLNALIRSSPTECAPRRCVRINGARAATG
jgi:Asp-tRNA(Asn)/Glu-tRNA(Gln) amidotransferase A subunit family amidase